MFAILNKLIISKKNEANLPKTAEKAYNEHEQTFYDFDNLSKKNHNRLKGLLSRLALILHRKRVLTVMQTAEIVSVQGRFKVDSAPMRTNVSFRKRQFREFSARNQNSFSMHPLEGSLDLNVETKQIATCVEGFPDSLILFERIDFLFERMVPWVLGLSFIYISAQVFRFWN